MASIPHTEPPIFIEYVQRGDHYHFDDANDTAAERRPIDRREAWIDMLFVPATPPPLAPWPGGPVVGFTRGVSGVPLGPVPGSAFLFSYQYSSPPPLPPFDHFLDMVPANYSGGVYAPTLRDAGLRVVPYDPSVWVADGLLGVIAFKYKTPQALGFSPPFSIDYWRYVGAFAGSGVLANDGGGAQVYEVGTVDPSLLRSISADTTPANLGLSVTQAASEIVVGNTMTGVNLEPSSPTVSQIFAQKNTSSGDLEFHALEAGLNVTLTETPTGVIINAAPGGGGISGLANEGVGADVFDVIMGSTAVLRRINGTANGLTVTQNATDITIDNTLTGANVGAGADWFRDKTANSLNLRSFVASVGSGLSLTQNADDITIDAAAGSVVDIANEGGGTGHVFDAVVANQANLRTLQADPAAANAGIAVADAGTVINIGNTMTGANVGAGSGTVFSAKSGATLQLNTLAGTANGLTVSAPAANVITIDNTLTGANVGAGSALFRDKTTSNLNFRSLIATADSGLTLTQNANDVTIGIAPGNGTRWVARDQKPTGTNGGDFPSAVWTRRDLNTLVSSGPTPGNVTLAGNVLSFAAGAYAIDGVCPAVNTPGGAFIDQHQTRFQNTTDATTIFFGSGNAVSHSINAGNVSIFKGIATFAAAKSVEVQHYKNGSGTSTNGFGLAVGAPGNVEVYTALTITQLS